MSAPAGDPVLKDMRKPKVALVSFYTTENTTLVFVVRPDLASPLIFDSGIPQSQVEVALAQLRQSINGGHDASLLPIDALRPWRRSFDHFEALGEPLLRFVADVADCDLLCFEPHGPLHGLPLHALRCDDGRYLIERFGVSYVPSASVLKHCQARNPARRPHETVAVTALAVGLGAKDDPDDVRVGFEADATELWSVLRFEDIRRLVGAEAASKAAVVAALPLRRLVHIACHGLFDPASPMRSGLLLSDGLDLPMRRRPPDMDLLSWETYRAERILTAQDLLGMRLRAELVSLRACQTGVSKIEAGDELLGLVRALVHAGAPSILVSLWNVNPHSSLDLLQRFYRSWLGTDEGDGTRTPKWKALQAAMTSLMSDDAGPTHHRHFYHWAPFVLVGDWL